MVNRFYLVREHRLHGIVTGLEAVRTVHSLDDKLDRLLVSLKDAKVRGLVASLCCSSAHLVGRLRSSNGPLPPMMWSPSLFTHMRWLPNWCVLYSLSIPQLRC